MAKNQDREKKTPETTKSQEKTVKMIFQEDMFYNDRNVPMYDKGKVHDVPAHMEARWTKRGGELYTDYQARIKKEKAVAAMATAAKEAAPFTPSRGHVDIPTTADKKASK